MKSRRTRVIQAALLVYVTAGVAQAQMIIFDPDDPNKAVGIANLNVLGTSWNVSFTGEEYAGDIYGYPGYYGPANFDGNGAKAAADAINLLLTAEGVSGVGDDASLSGSPLYRIGYSWYQNGTAKTIVWESLLVNDSWDTLGDFSLVNTFSDSSRWAVFSEVPEPSTGLLAALLASISISLTNGRWR